MSQTPVKTAPQETSAAAAEAASMLLEIGWIVASPLDEADRLAVEQARQEVVSYLQEELPVFRWSMPLLRREEMVQGTIAQPIALLERGLSERDIRHWDFTLMFTGADLQSHYRPYALATVSRSMEGAVFSTSRIDPQATHSASSREERVAKMARRLKVLVLHALGHLFGLKHVSDPDNVMYDLESVDDLRVQARFDAVQIEELNEALRPVADRRLEEEQGRRQTIHFYLASMWINRDKILRAVLEAAPWLFPVRLSRLTTAAISAMLVLLMTAEVWELGLKQPPAVLAGLSVVAVIFATVYVMVRQRLLVSRGVHQHTEQRVVTQASTVSIVLSGMLTTYLVLLSLSFGLGMLLFREGLVQHWAAVEGAIQWDEYLGESAFVASLGLCIGALGASFEQQRYFQHITYVDEEI